MPKSLGIDEFLMPFKSIPKKSINPSGPAVVLSILVAEVAILSFIVIVLIVVEATPPTPREESNETVPPFHSFISLFIGE